MNVSPRFLATTTLAATTLLLGACSSDDDSTTPAPQPTTIPGTLSQLNLDTLASLVTAAGLDATLEGAGPFTIFAPTDAAIAALGQTRVDFLSDAANVAVLTDLLEGHVANGDLDSAAVTAGATLTTLMGDVNVATIDGEVYINDTRISMADQSATNGTIHIIDAVIEQPNEATTASLTTDGFTTLVSALEAANLDGTLDGGAFTILAPTNAAFDALGVGVAQGLIDDAINGTPGPLQVILDRHLIQGAANTATAAITAGDVASGAAADGPRLFFSNPALAPPMVNGASISSFNRPTMGGLIHGIDAVITDPGTVVTVASMNASLSELVDAVTESGLIDDVDEVTEGPFTIFAPTNAALMAFETANPNLFMVANAADLKTLLEYHVVADAIQADELATLMTVTTVQADALTVTVDGVTGDISLSTDPGQVGNITANVTTANVLSNNAIVHVIDEVLVPPGFVFP